MIENIVTKNWKQMNIKYISKDYSRKSRLVATLTLNNKLNMYICG
jgi:hypothetical protein